MPYQTKEEYASILNKQEIIMAIAQYQPRDWNEANKSGQTRADLIRLASRSTLEQAYRQKTILKMMN